VSRIAATDRARRLLAVVPWIAAHPEGVPLDEVCERFAVDRSRLVSDLQTMSFVGLAPFTPDLLVEVHLDDDRVRIDLPQAFSRPLRLTPADAMALVAAGRSLLGVPGADADGPLARALAKLAVALGVQPDDIDIELGGADPSLLEDLRRAVAEARAVRLDYYSYGRDERSTRVVEPVRLHHEQGHWYLEAWCRSSGAERLFRVDRIERAELLEEGVAPRPSGAAGVFRPAAGTPRVVLDLAPAARWVVERYPCERVEERPDGSYRVTLAVGGRAWLERLLLILGPDAEMVEAPPELRTLTRDAAARVLARYDRR
jgi:proteasome accessory factor C